MFSGQLSFIFSIISIILGIAGILTAHYIIGGPLAVIGFWLSVMSVENCENRITPVIGAVASTIAFVWFSLLIM